MIKEIIYILVGCPIVAFFFALFTVYCLGSKESLIYNWTFFFFMLIIWDLCALFIKKTFRKDKKETK